MQIELFKHQLEFMKSQCTHTAIIGGFGCFLSGQKIITLNNNTCEIQDVKKGDLVQSFNLETKKVEVKKVLNTFKYSSDSYFKIKLKDGLEINVTKNHKFLFDNNWITIEKLLSLFIEIQEVDNKEINLKLS
jgi:intein/homing endonuclease